MATLKSEKIREKDRKKEVELLLGALTDERIAVLINLAKKITDFSMDDEKNKFDNVRFFPFLLFPDEENGIHTFFHRFYGNDLYG